MKKLFFCVALCFGILSVKAQTDPVVMTVNGVDVTRSEFEYSFNKNNADGVLDKKDVKDYVQLFVDFKLKVEAAKDAGIDTISAIRKELFGYKEQMVIPTLVDSDFIEREARNTYEQTAQHFAGQDMLTASHILVLLRQDADEAAQKAAKARIDSIYQVLKGGADFAEVAKNCSDDKGSAARGGSLGQFGKGMMIPDFEKAAYALKKGEMSEPIKSTVGYHIIKMEDRHPFESYEFHHDNILKFLEQRGIKEASANALIDSVAKKEGVSRDVIIGRYYDDLISKDSDSKNLAQEYYDGTLMYEISKNQIWDVAAKDEEGLAKYFKANKKKYAFDEPRFRGLILHGKDDAVILAAGSRRAYRAAVVDVVGQHQYGRPLGIERHVAV
jgi:peptidyl-prolyl cis-trans isomerase SurA